MKRLLLKIAFLGLLALLLFVSGCDKERIVQSKEYIHDVQVVTDTVVRIDTVVHHDSTVTHVVDTIRIHDTVRTTVYIHDTVQTVRNHYDTVVVRDTVVKTLNPPSQVTAMNAMEIQSDQLVMQFINQQFGLTDGWILYLTPEQCAITQVSSTVYDIDAYVTYWASDWSGYYPLEVYWRLTYTSGDPNDPNNWQMTDPPSAVSGHQPGIRSAVKQAPAKLLAR